MKKAEKSDGAHAKISAAQLRVLKDTQEISLPDNCEINYPDADDLNRFKLTITPNEGYYKNGTYTFSFTVGPEYPFEPPKVTCDTKIFHPNIDTEGKVCLNILRQSWTPVLTLNAVVYGLIYLLNEPNHEDALNKEAAELLRMSPRLFHHQVQLEIAGARLESAQKRTA